MALASLRTQTDAMKSSELPTPQNRPRELGAAFDAYLKRRRKLSPRTVQAYTYNGAGMVEFFKSRGAKTIDDVTLELAEAWVDWLLTEGRSGARANA